MLKKKANTIVFRLGLHSTLRKKNLLIIHVGFIFVLTQLTRRLRCHNEKLHCGYSPKQIPIPRLLLYCAQLPKAHSYATLTSVLYATPKAHCHSTPTLALYATPQSILPLPPTPALSHTPTPSGSVDQTILSNVHNSTFPHCHSS